MLLLLLALGIDASASQIPPTAAAPRLEHLGHVSVGDLIEKFPAISGEHKHCRKAERTAQFYVYYFKAGLPARCFNLHCGAFATQIMARGGRLIGGADPQFGKELGVEPGSTQSVLMISDGEGKVTAIYKDVSLSSLSELLASQ
jgi:hypothetical protein